MTTLVRPPRSGPLRAVVSALWWWEVDIDHSAETVLPTGTAQLVLDCRPAALGGLLQGPTSRWHAIDVGVQQRAAGVVFRPGGLAPFLGGPVAALADLAIDLPDVWGRHAGELPERLACAPTPAAALDLLEHHLLARLRHSDHSGEPLVALAEARLRRGEPVAATAAGLEIDRRVLASRFRATVGLGLKRYSRVCRVHRTVRALRQPAAPSLASLAADHGFADQAHLTREFRAIAGYTPGQLHRRPEPSPTHVVADEIVKTPPATDVMLAP